MAVIGNLAELYFRIRGKILTDAGMLFYGAVIMFYYVSIICGSKQLVFEIF